MKEDDQIKIIGNYVKDNPGKKVGIVVDDIPGVPERYIEKLTIQYPVEVLFSGKGPNKGMWTITLKYKGVPLLKDN